MSRHPYRLDLPETVTTPVVVASPHSGRYYPRGFTRQTVLDERTIRSSEDAFMDMLVAEAPSFGAPLLVAEFPRAYVDLNRNADELDPGVVAGLRRPSQNPRISSGLGVIPRVVANGRVIYRGKLSLEEAEARIARVWHPYHGRLEDLICEAQIRFGQAILLDFHSMPHEALNSTARPGQPRPEVVLGDRFGASCDGAIVGELEAAFASAGLVVSRNAPFAGAFVTQHYGRPSRGRHAIQIEIDRALYMDETLIRPNGNFQNMKALITEVLRRVTGSQMGQMPLAAE
ncbi:N-formylglutamate amidohydrolase [Rhodophyticola sp. CCM32]|uniref:N-formylglutamate amidohydrolase n=1 Tax=Rhodophyticola sp. CCM32 TaxID=2916397 RepID=UPI00107F6241|nr:N-formylglutamate amidohydrolase [Rhodophyticola sp. CCM32]QBY02438.1 N-formylglutamate amidohydrolase [Rhodophyticola sp. CCM32]